MNNSTQSAEFLAKFQTERDAIQSQIDKLKNKTSVSVLDMQPISARITALAASFTLERAAEFLPAYDQRLFNEQMYTLEAGLEALRSRAPSRGKFSFKKKAPTAASTPTTASTSASASASVSTTPAPPSSATAEPEKEERRHPGVIPRPPNSEPWGWAMQHGRQFGNIYGGTITASGFFRPDEADKKSIKAEVTLVSLRNCIINLLPGADPQGKEIVVTALYARDLQCCVILAGLIPGSVRMEKTTFGMLIVGCHQLRMESCESVAVHSAIKTAPAIEKSKLIGFGQYPSMLPYTFLWKSKADEVQDFSSVGAGPSRNWKKIPDGSRNANHYIQLCKMDPRDWPNDGKILPYTEEAKEDEAKEDERGMSPESEDAIDLSGR